MNEVIIKLKYPGRVYGSRPLSARATMYVWAASLLFGSGSLHAQADSVSGATPWSIGGAVGIPGYGSQTSAQLFTVAFQAAQIAPGRLGADVSIGTMPRILLERAFAIGVRGGIVLPVAVSPASALLPSAGVSLAGALSGTSAGSLAGLNAGIAFLAGESQGKGLKLGVTWHQFRGADSPMWLFEIGVLTRGASK